MPETLTQVTSSNVSLDAIKLQPGAVMQIQSCDEGGQVHHDVRFVGVIKSNSFLVTVPMTGGTRMWMKPGSEFILRGFNGRYAYAFTSKVIRAREQPFPYVHFSYPPSVEYKAVRHSLRIGVTQPATVTTTANSPVAVTMLDLSASGSMIESPESLGNAGDLIHLAFTVPLEGHEVSLSIAAVIRNIYQTDDTGRGRIGLAFEDVSQNDNLILHYFLEIRQEEIV